MALFLAGLRSVDDEIVKAAAMDGAGPVRTYVGIILPMLRPVFLSAIIVLAHLAIKSFDLVIALTAGGPGIATDLPATFMYAYAFQRSELGLAAASAVMMLVTIMAVVVPYLYRHHLAVGLFVLVRREGLLVDFDERMRALVDRLQAVERTGDADRAPQLIAGADQDGLVEQVVDGLQARAVAARSLHVDAADPDFVAAFHALEAGLPGLDVDAARQAHAQRILARVHGRGVGSDQLDAGVGRIGGNALQQRARSDEGFTVGDGGEQILLGLRRPREGTGGSEHSDSVTTEIHRRCSS